MALFAGFWACTLAAPAAIRSEPAIIGACGLLAFAAGIAEDLTKKGSARCACSRPCCRALRFSLITGHVVASLEIGFVNHYALAFP